MNIPLSAIVEMLSGGHDPHAPQIIANPQVIRDDIASPQICGVQLCTKDALPDSFAETMLYIVDETANTRMSTSSCPKHALVVVKAKATTKPTAWHDSCASLAVASSDAQPVAILNAAARCLAEYNQWDADLADAILASRRIDEIVGIGARALANPIAFFDTGSALVAQSGTLPKGFERTIWGRVVADGASPMDFYTADEQRELTRRFEVEELPVILTPERSPQHANLAALVKASGKTRGTIGQVDLIAPFTPAQVFLAHHVRLRLQQYFALAGNAGEDADELAGVLARMLDGYAADRSILSFHLRGRAWAIEDRYRITVCPILQGTESRVSNTTRVRNLGACFADALPFVHGGAVVILEHATGKTAKDPLKGGKFKAAVASFDMSAASSIWFRSLADVVVYYRQALICLAEAERAGLTGVISYRDVFESHIAHLIASNVPPESICDPGVLSLAREGYKGDAEQGRELVEQLYVFLASGRNLHRCARLLYIHHNTLAYRMERLSALLDVDFAQLDPHEVMHLELSCLLALHT